MYLIPEAVLRALILYLSKRPFREVHEAIAALQALEPVPPPAPEKE